MLVGSIRIKIRIGTSEIEVEGSKEEIGYAIDLIPNIIDRLSMNNSSSISKDIPSISIDKKDSLSDIIIKIFKDDWGRNARRLAEVKEVLDSYGLTYPKQSIAVTLMRLAQSGKLRRFKNEQNEYVYTSSIQLLNG